MKLLKNKKGFTLIELLAVIIILGVLMALAIPSMTHFQIFILFQKLENTLSFLFLRLSLKVDRKKALLEVLIKMIKVMLSF